jgi:hypothetical protein
VRAPRRVDGRDSRHPAGHVRRYTRKVLGQRPHMHQANPGERWKY